MSVRERRLLLGLGVCALFAAAYLSLQWAGDQRENYARAASDLAAAQGRSEAPRRLAAPADPGQLQEADQSSITASNVWLARLKVERLLDEAARQAGVVGPEIDVAQGLETDAGATVLRADVSGPYVGQSLVRLLHGLSASPKTVVVESLEAKGGNVASFKLTVLYPVVLDASGERP